MKVYALLFLLFLSSCFTSSASFSVNNFWPRGDSGYVLFRLYTRSTINNPGVYDTRSNDRPFQQLDVRKPTKVLIHGWKGYGNCTFTRELTNAYLSKFDYNVIAVDWSGDGSKDNLYPEARSKVNGVARIVAKFLDDLATQKGLQLWKLHVLGHSLGAHISGIAGRLVTKGKIGRITGLDPAGPMFSKTDTSGRLAMDSAMFVDVIHTTNGYLGLGVRMGHVDFYPNGGHMIQPGCGIDVIGRCSHQRSYYFYKESIYNPQAFPAVSCFDWEHYQHKDCFRDNVVYMGEEVSQRAGGEYFLETNKQSPFGKYYVL